MRVDRWSIVLAGALAGALAIAGGALAAPASQQQVTVAMTSERTFAPASVTVPVGSTVTWVNQGGRHSTTSNDGLWDSGIIAEGATFSFTFTTPGTYRYYCIPHQSLGMVGTITVTGPGGAAAPSGAGPTALPSTGSLPLQPLALAASVAGLAATLAGWRLRRR